MLHRRARTLFICGNREHTQLMHAVATTATELDAFFTPYYCDDGTALDWMRRLRLLEYVALGGAHRRTCMAYLRAHALRVDVGGRGRYDLVVTCADLAVPSNIAGLPTVGVKQRMPDQPGAWWTALHALAPMIVGRVASAAHAHDVRVVITAYPDGARGAELIARACREVLVTTRAGARPSY